MLIALFSILFIILFIPTRLYLRLENLDSKIRLSIKIKLLFISVNKKYSTPATKLLAIASRKKIKKDEVKEALDAKRVPFKNWKLIARRIKKYIPLIAKIFEKAKSLLAKISKPIKCEKLILHTQIGFIDPFYTSMCVAFLWSIKGIIISKLTNDNTYKLKNYSVKVLPEFDRDKLILNYECIFVFPFVYIIIVIYQMVRFFKAHKILKKEISK